MPLAIELTNTSPIPPAPHCLVTDVDAALKQRVFDIAQRQGTPAAHHDDEQGRLPRRVETAKRIGVRRDGDVLPPCPTRNFSLTAPLQIHVPLSRGRQRLKRLVQPGQCAFENGGMLAWVAMLQLKLAHRNR